MERINEFYKDILTALGLEVTDKGHIFVKSGKAKLPLTINGLPAVLPTQENINNVITIDENGNPKLQYFLFNPAYEDPIKGFNPSLNKLREIMYRRLEQKTVALMETLFNIIKDNQEVKSTGVTEFTELLIRYKNKQIKQMIDDGTIEVLLQLYDISKKSKNPLDNFLHIYLNKGAELNGVKYNRIASTLFHMYERVVNLKVKSEDINGIKLRNKDKFAIISGYEYIFKDVDVLTKGYQVGSANKIAPGLHALLVSYIDTGNVINNAVGDIKEDIDDTLFEALLVKMPKLTDTKELDEFIESLEEDLKFIPKETDLELKLKGEVAYTTPVRQPVSNQTAQTVQNDADDPVLAALGGQPTQPMQQMPMGMPGIMNPMQPPIGMMQQPTQQPIPDDDPVLAALMRG